MNWYFVRHGEIESNRKKVYAGWNDEGLTATGWRQAKDAAEQLLNYNIEAIYCSPLRRTVQTAKIIADLLNQMIIVDEHFKELKLGIWEGMSEEEIVRRFPSELHQWNVRPADFLLEGRETLGQLLKRVLRGMAEIASVNSKKSILVVTHVAIIRVLLLYFQNMHLNLYRTIPIPNGEIFPFEGIGLQQLEV